MDFSLPFQKAWESYKDNFWELTLGYMIMVVVSSLTLGILFPGMYVGFNQLALKALRGKKVIPADIFKGIGQYWNMLGLIIYIFLILLLLGLTLIGIIPAILIATWWMYSGIFVADKKYSISRAMKSSKKIVRKNNVWLHLIFWIITGIIGNAGCSLAYIGYLLTMPFSMLVICAAYLTETKSA